MSAWRALRGERIDRPRSGAARGAFGAGRRLTGAAEVLHHVEPRAADIRPARAMVLVAVVATGAALLGIGVRARFGGHVAVDEPQYLLTALSLFEDGGLDIADELAARRWVPWAGTGDIPVQTEVLAGGRQISPHDPLLPLLLALPMGLGGWIAAKATLALLAGALAAVTLWTAVRRFAVPLRLATVGVAVAAASAPLAVYGQQVYPELPAALGAVSALAVLTGPALVAAGSRVRWRSIGLLVALITALPWLSVKYTPVAAALTVLGGWRVWRGTRPALRPVAAPAAPGRVPGQVPDQASRAAARVGAGGARVAAAFAGTLAVLGASYLAVHRLVWGGWTVYASGDHFQESGEFGVMGFDPDFAGRSLRLVGLLVDRGYGLAAWQPAWLLLLSALGVLLAAALTRGPGTWREPLVPAAPRPRRGPGGRFLAVALLLPLAAGWLTAAFVALTMHGFWWPGRQTVVVLPFALLAVLVMLARGPALVRWTALGLGVVGVVNYLWLLADGFAVRLTWVSGFEAVGSPGYGLIRPLLPDYRLGWSGFWPYHLVWTLTFLLLITYAWRTTRKENR